MKRKAAAHPVPASHPPPVEVKALEPVWKPHTRVLFRFSSIYLCLFALATQVSGSMIPNLLFEYRGLGLVWPFRGITIWIAASLFGFTAVPDSLDPSDGGESVFYWIQAFWILVLALVATGVWTALSRRESHEGPHRWVRFFFRLGLAAQMFEYGVTKIIPNQFGPPSLTRLVEPVGDLSTRGLLWTSIGAAPGYEIFTGCVELLGGILLLLPWTSMLGAIVCLAATTHILVLNLAYDVGLILTTFHLVLIAMFLLAPDLKRLSIFFLTDRDAPPPRRFELFGFASANRIVMAATVVFGVYLLGMETYMNVRFRDVVGARSPRSALYGIWDVELLSIDGEAGPPQLNDYDRQWRRVIFDEPGRVVFQRTDDSFARYGVSIDSYGKRFSLTKGGSRTWKSAFIFERPGPDRLILDGEMDGHKIRAELRLLEFDTIRLLNSDFRWIRNPDP